MTAVRSLEHIQQSRHARMTGDNARAEQCAMTSKWRTTKQNKNVKLQQPLCYFLAQKIPAHLSKLAAGLKLSE